MKALIIEDNGDVVEAVSLCLQLRWPEIAISTVAEGNRGIEILRFESFDIIILDLNLPDIDGTDVLREIRSFSSVPVIILTVRGKEDDQARGLELGADDYIVKPFRARDLVARVNAVLRRSQVPQITMEQPSLTRGNFTLNLTAHSVQLGEEAIKLTPTECKLLYVLMTNAGHTLGNERILQEVWEEKYMNPDLLRTHIRRIRQKLKDKPPQIILNQRRGGYRFVSPI